MKPNNKTQTRSKMRSTRSAKKTALKRLSSCFEEDNIDKSEDSSDNTSGDTSDNSDNPDDEGEVFTEEDIVLVDYDGEDLCKPTCGKRKRKAKGSRGKAVLQDSGIEEDLDVAEAIVVDFDLPIRKLQSESKIFLKNLDILRIPEIITDREISRFALLEKICKANLKRQSMDEVMLEEEEEERRSEENMSTLRLKPVKRVRFE